MYTSEFTNDQGDELGEEIRPPRLDNEPDVGEVGTGVPVRLVFPEFDIVDLMAGRRKGRPPKAQTSSSQNDPAQLDEPQPGPSSAPDIVIDDGIQNYSARKRERTVNTDVETDVERPEAKASKLRPKRTRDQLMKHAARLLPYKPGTTVKTRIPANLQTNDQRDELGEEIRPPRLDNEPDGNILRFNNMDPLFKSMEDNISLCKKMKQYDAKYCQENYQKKAYIRKHYIGCQM